MTVKVIEYRDGIVKCISPGTGRVYMVRLLSEHAHRLGEIGWSRRILRKLCRSHADAVEYREQVIRRLRYLRIIGRLMGDVERCRLHAHGHVNTLRDCTEFSNEIAEGLAILEYRYRHLEVIRFWIRKVIPWTT